MFLYNTMVTLSWKAIIPELWNAFVQHDGYTVLNQKHDNNSETTLELEKIRPA